MIRRPLLLSALLALFAASLGAQAYRVSSLEVGELPATCGPEGKLYVVTNAADADDCSVGGGTLEVACYCNAAGNGYNSSPRKDERRSMAWLAGSVSTDGTNCADPTERTINSGPKRWAFSCADNASSRFYFDAPMPDGWDGGTVTLELSAVNENASPSGVLEFDFQAMCRGDSDVINSTWGTLQSASLTFGTQFDLEQVETVAITPDGTCAAGDHLFFRASMDDTATTTQVADTFVLSVKMEYETNSED